MTDNTSELTIHGGDYEHTQTLGGDVAGARLRYATTRRVQEIFIGMLETRRFEICEFSLANYITLRAAGERWLTAIPVFPSRVFRHGLAVSTRVSGRPCSPPGWWRAAIDWMLRTYASTSA